MSPTVPDVAAVPDLGEVTVALAGNPNAGKTAVFNAMTGVRQKTGNWPGVTVERKEGRYSHAGRRFRIFDLPGTYSLDPDSPDQQVTRDIVRGPDVDVVVNVVDAGNLERHLYLGVQLVELGLPVVLVLNMMDVAEKQGITIDCVALGEALGCEVVPVVGVTGSGIKELRAAIARLAPGSAAPTIAGDASRSHPGGPGGCRCGGDRRGDLDGRSVRDLDGEPLSEGSVGHQADLERAEQRFDLARDIANLVVTRPNTTVGNLSDRIDDLVVHRLWGVPIFLGVMYLLFLVTITIGGSFVDLFDGVAGALVVDGPKEILGGLGAPEWLIVLLADGIGGGIQVVASFVPIVGALYLSLSLLEDSGYLVRAAFVMDRSMRRIGLPGKAFVPMIVGFGCNVPAVMATRTLDSQRERKLTILMNPFMSCGARLPVYALFAAAFFPGSGQNLVFLLYLTGIGAAVATGFIMRHSLLPGASDGFLMELPSYHRPTVRSVLLHTWDRLRLFVTEAGKVIVAMVVVLALLSSVGTDGSFGNEDSDSSILGELGRAATPAFGPMGLDDDNWPATVGILTGVLAKEAVVGALDSLYGEVGDGEAGVVDEEEPFVLRSAIGDALRTVPENLADSRAAWADPLGLDVGDVDSLETAAAAQEVDAGVYDAMEGRFDGRIGAFAYLLFILLYFPCVAVIGAIGREAGRRWALFVVVWTTGLAYTVATAVYQAGTFARHPVTSTAWLVASGSVYLAAFVGLRMWARRQPAAGEVPVTIGTGRRH